VHVATSASCPMFHDPDQRRLLFATPDRDARTFAAFVGDITAYGCAGEHELPASLFNTVSGL